MRDDGSIYVSGHGAFPCRYINHNVKNSIEALSLEGGHFLLYINEKTNVSIKSECVSGDLSIMLNIDKQE